MPEESTTPNLEEALRRSMEAFSRRDLDASTTLYTPDAVWDWSHTGLGVYEGRDAIRRLFEEWWNSYDGIDQVLEEFLDLGNGVTFAVANHRGRLVGSSASVELRYGAVGIWVDGLVQRMVVYGADIAAARAAAGQLAVERE
jgi:ketosteroid isomerase-like protein